ncbi:MAG: acyl carrier protein [Flavobacteriales bacterium]|nr:acyl carrier protein [Flavobacteriales bacterium]
MSKLIEIMSEKLSIPKEDINDETAYNVAKNWDSINHLAIVSALEDAYGIELDVDEITAMENVKVIKDILTKHGIKDL